MFRLFFVVIIGAFFLSFVMFMQFGPRYGVAALILAVGLSALFIVLAIPRMRRNIAASKESNRRLAEKLGMDDELIFGKPRFTCVYRNRQIEIDWLRRDHVFSKKFYSLLSVSCSQNQHGLSFHSLTLGKNNKTFNNETFKAAVLTEERLRTLGEHFASAGYLRLDDLTVSYKESDGPGGGVGQKDRFNLMLDIACDIAELVERFPETPVLRNPS